MEHSCRSPLLRCFLLLFLLRFFVLRLWSMLDQNVCICILFHSRDAPNFPRRDFLLHRFDRLDRLSLPQCFQLARAFRVAIHWSKEVGATEGADNARSDQDTEVEAVLWGMSAVVAALRVD